MKLGDYRILSRIGEGRDGATYRAQLPREDTHVEIRTLERVRADPERWRPLVEQVRLAARLDEPSAQRVRELRLENDPPFVVLEWVEGASLAEALQDRVPLPLTEAADLALVLAAALAAAHRLGLSGQLCSHKLRMSSAGLLKIDFTGIDGPAMAGKLDLLLDAACRAPEARAASPATGAEDVYGLGVLLNWIFFGFPLGNLSSQELPTLLGEGQLAEREFFRPLLDEMLAQNPEARPTMREVYERLSEQKKCLQGETAEAPPAISRLTTPELPKGRNKVTMKRRRAGLDLAPPAPLDRAGLVQIVSRAGEASAEELGALLHRRLRFLSLVFVALYVSGSLLRTTLLSPASWSLDSWTVVIALFVLAGLAGLLWSGRPLSIRQLRTIELAFFGTLAVRFAIRAYAVLSASRRAGAGRRLAEHGTGRLGGANAGGHGLPR
jgi:hypothetical protein